MRRFRIVGAPRRRGACFLPACGLMLALAGCGGSDRTADQPEPARAEPAFTLSNNCYAMAVGDGWVAENGEGYDARAGDAQSAARFWLKPTALGRYLLHDGNARLLAVGDPLNALADAVGEQLTAAGELTVGYAELAQLLPQADALDSLIGDLGETISDNGATLRTVGGSAAITADDGASRRAEWAVAEETDGVFGLRSTATALQLVRAPDGSLALAEPEEGANEAARRVRFAPAEGCTPYPEIAIAAEGTPIAGRHADGTVKGIADTHVHLMSGMRLGGRVIHGDAFHRFGAPEALRACTENHGPQGSTDVLGNLQRDGVPTGTHATEGWPGFSDWPAFDTYTHQQNYYVWLERVWRAGLRLVVNHVNADAGLCRLMPLKAHSCNEMEAIRLQIAELRRMQDYIDAQEGGPGQGWFRIVESPTQARSVVEAGKLAVVIGVEASRLFDCGLYLDSPECSRAEIDERLAELKALGVRSVFLAHWFNSGLAGPGLFGPLETELNIVNRLETGEYFEVSDCPEPGLGGEMTSLGAHIPGDDPLSNALNAAQHVAVPTYPPAPHCNARGLSELGEYAVQRIFDAGLLIETDHLSARAKNALLDIAEARGQPVVAGHFGTGGKTSDAQTARIFASGGLASPMQADLPGYVDTIRRLGGFLESDRSAGIGFASDSGGLAEQPRLTEEALALEYPFELNGVRFERQRSGERVFDINEDGVAHYGLYADFLASLAQQPGGEEAMERLMRSAEATIRSWERAAGGG